MSTTEIELYSLSLQMAKRLQIKKITSRNEKVAVIGIGRVGFPLALVLADEGFQVYGIGRKQEKIDALNKGKMPFLEHGGKTLLDKHRGKNFIATTDYSVISTCKYIILTLGTPVDENMNPMFDQIDASIRQAKAFLRDGQVLILRSTVSPRTTQYVRSILEEKRGFRVGKNFFLAFCPERITEGNAIDEIKTIPQIVGGGDKESIKKASQLFRTIGVETLETDDISAELAKLFTNMYRYISFAIANEFMLLADMHRKNIYEIVRLVNHNYKRGGLYLPGMTAGPCLVKDGFFLVSDLPFADLISTSWKINESVPIFFIRKLREEVRLEGKKVVILGLAFKSEVDDPRGSLSFKVRKALLRERARVVLHDPFVQSFDGKEVERDLYEAIQDADVLFIATNHKQYSAIDHKKLQRMVKKNCIICDVWNVFGTNKIIFRSDDLSSR